MIQTTVQNTSSIFRAYGAKLEVYAEYEFYSDWLDLGALVGDINFSLDFGSYSGEVDTFQQTSAVATISGGTLTFDSIELRPAAYYQLTGKAFTFLLETIGDITASILEARKIRITALDEESNTRILTLYKTHPASLPGYQFKADGVNNNGFTFRCEYDSSGKLYEFEDTAGIILSSRAVLGDAVSDYLLGDPITSHVLGDIQFNTEETNSL